MDEGNREHQFEVRKDLVPFHCVLLGIYRLQPELTTFFSRIMGDIIPSFVVSLTRTLITVSGLRITDLVVIVVSWAIIEYHAVQT